MRGLLIAPLLLLNIGCIKTMLLNGQIEGTRQASAAFDTISDYEVADRAAANGLVQFEGMHRLAPSNENALFMLTKGWTGYAYGFIEDALEVAQDDGDRAGEAYHKRRAIQAYDRAIGYGLELLAQRAKGFEEVKGNEQQLRAWLEKSFTAPEDAENLFWPAYAWIARTNVNKDDAETVSMLYVGVAMMERSVAIDPTYNRYSGMTVLASYHARAAMAELDEAQKLFEEVISKTERKSLIVLFNYATKHACVRSDVAAYQKLLQEVLAAEDSDPGLRLTNAIARRRARRWLSEKRMFDACSMEVGNASS